MISVKEAFEAVDRKNFLPREVAMLHELDEPLPIGYGQTNSQPTTVRMMLGWLSAREGDKVLDVGSGSGWTTALLAHLVGKEGKVYAVETVAELVDFGRANCKRAELDNVSFHRAGKQLGLTQHAPFDCILVSASANKLPASLLDQLKIGGKMIVPVGYDVLEIIKKSHRDTETTVHTGFIFVPLME